MITDFNLEHHYRPKKGWMNDPNGLVYYKGYYHAFYQHVPDHEVPVFEKYDDYVPPELIRRAFAYGVLTIDEMRRRMLYGTEQSAVD